MTFSKFIGNWTSDYYPNVSGTVEIDLPYYYTEHFETVLTIKYHPQSGFRAGQERRIELQGTFGDTSGQERYVLMPKQASTEQMFMLTFSHKSASNNWKGQYSCLNPSDVGKITVAPETTCLGCLEGILNQEGHMDYGGCLYCELSDDPPVVDHRSL